MQKQRMKPARRWNRATVTAVNLGIVQGIEE
jgi:hypothetical protein